MVRQWFSVTAVLAGVMLMLAIDSSQAQVFGRRFRNNTEYVPGPQMMGDVIVYPPAPPGSPEASQVFLEIRVPNPDADISIGGEKTTQKGTIRRYLSPTITPGRTYTYEIDARWMENGREVTRMRNLQVMAGQRLGIDLARPTPQTMPADQVTQERRSQYFAPEMNGGQALLEVRAPANAELTIGGQGTMQKGPTRLFVSPPIEPGLTYTYEVTAKWMDNGKPVTRTKTVEIRAGQTARVDLTQPSGGQTEENRQGGRPDPFKD
jgi:uncharacterized protein (TIGR03000 family)